jgi:hypothetical protein
MALSLAVFLFLYYHIMNLLSSCQGFRASYLSHSFISHHGSYQVVMAFGLAVFLNGSQASCLPHPLLSHPEPYQAGMAYRLAVFLISLLSHHGSYQAVMAFGLSLFSMALILAVFLILYYHIMNLLSSCQGFRASYLSHSFISHHGSYQAVMAFG